MNLNRTIQFIFAVGICIAINALAQSVHFKWDLTEDRRYTLTEPTRDLLREMDDVIYVHLMLDGELPAGFKRLQRASREMLDQFRGVNPSIHYRISDPRKGSVTQMNAVAEQLAEDGIIPTRLRVRDAGESQEKLIYPYAVFRYGDEMLPVKLLENEQPGMDNEVILNNSISLLEYKFAHAIELLRRSQKPNIVLIEGHGELEPQQTAYLVQSLRSHYNVARIDLDSVVQLHSDIDLAIVAKPQDAFSDKELFVLDQYAVNGGNLMFFVDPLNVALDSITGGEGYIPIANELNLNPLLFKYGARIQPDLVLDLECTRIPLVVGQLGDRVQTELFPWYYHPLVAPTSEHPIVKGIDRVNFQFPASIDTVQTKANIRKEILVTSSEYSRIQRIPVRLNFEILRYEPEVDKFNNGYKPLAVLLEGRQVSLFENRVTEEMTQALRAAGADFVAQDKPSKVLVVSDGDVIKNAYNPSSGEISEIGYNKFENFTFGGNKAFILNAIEYMIDDSGIIEARAKEVQLRRLDVVKAKAEAVKWQIINVVLPLVLLVIGVWLYNFSRKRRYGRS